MTYPFSQKKSEWARAWYNSPSWILLYLRKLRVYSEGGLITFVFLTLSRFLAQSRGRHGHCLREKVNYDRFFTGMEKFSILISNLYSFPWLYSSFILHIYLVICLFPVSISVSYIKVRTASWSSSVTRSMPVS